MEYEEDDGAGNKVKDQMDNEDHRRYLIMDVFKKYILEHVQSSSLLLCLAQHIPKVKEKLPELRRLDKNGKHEESMSNLLEYLDSMMDEGGKWRSFIEALKDAEYPAVYDCLVYIENLPTAKDDEDFSLITLFLNEICTRVSLENGRILIFLLSKKVINQSEMEKIRACINNHSNADAMLELYMHLRRRDRNWYAMFLESLLNDGQNELVKEIDPKFYSVREEHHKCNESFSWDKMDYDIQEHTMEGGGEAYDSGDMAQNNSMGAELNNLSNRKRKLESLESDFYNNSTDSITEKVLVKKMNIAVDAADDVIMDDSQNTEPDVAGAEKNLDLRDYQKELCKEALLGQNVIISAPTGCGKTIVAIKIIKEHLAAKKIRKVAFLVTQLALATQQFNLMKEYLNCRIEMITGDTQTTDKMPLGKLLEVNDVIVMTAQILVDSMLEGGVKDVTSFSLIILDECHHTKARHPYNQIMNKYMDIKLKHQTSLDGASVESDYYHIPPLPQIVGLTASVGVGRTSHLNGAVEHIMSLCANLDSSKICTGQGYEQDMTKYVNVPETTFQTCEKRKNDVFYQTVVEIIQNIEKDMAESPFLMVDEDEIREFKTHLKPPSKKGHQSYIQWVSNLKRAIARVDDSNARKFFVTCYKMLEILNAALIINSDCRAKDSLEYMQEEMEKNITPNQSKDARDKLMKYYTEKVTKLERLSRDPSNVNPKLQRLESMIIEGFEKNPDSRAIVFAKTLSLVQKLKNWMEETPSLRRLNLNPETVTGARCPTEKGGMTRNHQMEVLECFKDGIGKLIIATSVAEEGLDIQKCNLVIRYDNVTNLIAMVQARGRARAEESKFVIVSGEESNSEKKEQMNLCRELLMKQAIIKLNELTSKEFKDQVLLHQENAKTYRDFEQSKRKGRILSDSEFELRCFQCNTLACYSTDIRTITRTQYTVIEDDFKNSYTTKPQPKPVQFKAGFIKKKKIYCKKCQYDWGSEALYQNVDYPLIKIESFVIEDLDGRKKTVKKWKDVPFSVSEISNEDLHRKSQEASGNISHNDSDNDYN